MDDYENNIIKDIIGYLYTHTHQYGNLYELLKTGEID